MEIKRHFSDCATHNEPYYPAGKCNCGTASVVIQEVLKSKEKILLIAYQREDGDYDWVLSFEGMNPTANECIVFRSRADAEFVLDLIMEIRNLE